MANYTPLPNVAHIAQAMDFATADANRIPGAVAVVVDKNGNTVFQHASGKRGADTDESMTCDHMFWTASCTKMVCAIAAMQLVERGILSLDDADQVETLAPELKAVRILTGFDSAGQPEFIPKRNRITLRHLLTHTAGFGYSFFDQKMNLYNRHAGTNEIDGHPNSVLNAPLLHEPGSDWTYGAGLDWAGTLIERATSTRLNDYLHTHIFAPLNLHGITMFPTPSQRAQLAHMNQKRPNAPTRSIPHSNRRPLSDPADPTIHHSAGHGLFARPTDLAQILPVLLNNGLHAPTNTRILTPESVAEMFTNQIPSMPNFGRKGIVSPAKATSNDIPDLYPQFGPGGEGLAQGWGISFMLTADEGKGGRGAGTGWWAGLPNLFWWADREKGVGGVVGAQVVPFADKDVLGLWRRVEWMVYEGLRGGEGKARL